MIPYFKYFSEEEILGASRTRKYTLDEIPEDLHQNIVPTMQVLTALRAYYGKAIFLNCTYRDEDHNTAVKGESNSLHLLFNAVDFTISKKEDLSELYKKLTEWDAVHTFEFLPKKGSMGIGRYSTFIHLDTRALLGYKSPARWRK